MPVRRVNGGCLRRPHVSQKSLPCLNARALGFHHSQLEAAAPLPNGTQTAKDILIPNPRPNQFAAVSYLVGPSGSR